MTNYEKIKQMSLVELAALLASKISSCEHCAFYYLCKEYYAECHTVLEDWLKSEEE